MDGLSLYQSGASWLHRAGPGAKLGGLVLFALGVVMAQGCLPGFVGPTVLGGLAVLVTAMFVQTGLGWRLLWRQVRPLIMFVCLVGAMHVIGGSWRNAIAVPLTIVVLVVSAGLVTLTTPASAMVDVVTKAAKPLRRIGVDPSRVGLAVLLGLRCVPLMTGLASGVRQAQLARCGTFSIRAFAVPFVVAALRQAEATGEALVARGVDD